MKGFVGVTHEEDSCLIGLLPRDIGGQACKRRRRNTLRNVISVEGSRRIFTSLEEFSILFLALAICSMGLGHCGTFPQSGRK